MQTGDNVMIGGFILSGATGTNVLVRAIGPSWPVDGQLDPFLELYDGNGVLMQSNNNWKDTQQTEIEAMTIPPQTISNPRSWRRYRPRCQRDDRRRARRSLCP